MKDKGKSMEKNLLVGQSGGPTCVINSSLYGIIKEAKKHLEINKIYGSLNGIEGTINDQIIDLTSLDEMNLELLKQTPGAILGSARYCLKDNLNDNDYKKIKETFVKHNIHYFLYIGGNDSMDTVNKINMYFQKNNFDCQVIGIPKTIDNDLLYSDHTPGYASAIRFIANSINDIKQDIKCYKKGKVTIVEIMGRNTGWLAAGSKLASLNDNAPDLIYLPEGNFSIAKFVEDVKNVYQKNQNALVCVNEEIKDENGQYLLQENNNSIESDSFGHKQFGGVANNLATIIKNKLHIPVRAIELNLLQRCFSSISLVDIKEAINCGKFAVRQLLKNQTGKVVILKRNPNQYRISYKLISVDKIANKIKYFPKEWIINDNDISNKFIEYALPLITKSYHCKCENGLVKFAKLKK